MSIAADLEERLQALNEVLASAESDPDYARDRQWREAFRAWTSGINTWCKVREQIDAPRVREQVRREILAELNDVLDELPPGASARLRLALLESTERAAA